MQKKIISMAIAGLVSSFAFAQSNVTIYGIADAGFSSFSGDGQNSTGVHSSGLSTSRLGFRGEEALGNGLKAIFNFESRISLDNNAAWDSYRQSNVGLAGNFGTVKFGRQSSLSDAWHGGAGAENFGNLSSRNVANNTLRGGFANRKLDGIGYMSPVFSGFTFGAVVAFDDEGGADNLPVAGKPGKTTDNRDTMYQLGVNYANGPLTAAATFALQDHDVYKSQKEYTVAAAYNFGVVTLSGAYEAVKDVYSGTRGTTPLEDNATWSLGLSIPVMAKGKVHVGYSQTDNDAKKSDYKAFLLGYQHSLSKRTDLYAAYQRLDNDKNARYTPNGRYADNLKNATFIGNADESYNGFIMGIRHTF